jgi:hypothetical protein
VLDFKNVFCIFVDDVLYPFIIAYFSMIFAPILVVMAMADSEPMMLILATLLEVFSVVELYDVIKTIYQ